MKLSSFRRMITQDFAKDYQELVEQLGSTINDSFNSVYLALNKRITFADNIASTVKQITVTVDSEGNLPQLTRVTLDVKNSPVIGVICIRAVNLTNPLVYPVAAPLISYTQNANEIVINNIKGLQANTLYQLTIIAIN